MQLEQQHRQRTQKRLSVALSGKDQEDLDLIASSPTILQDLPDGASSSRSALVHAVFEKGMAVIKEAEAEQAYAEMAQEQRKSAAARRKRAVNRPRGRAGAQ
ncbi:hypothetical protein [Rothia halotolerans]|uniref:hypothetical protein n=1 Tax=Rothia halotolerans TaxID=405770 RepID=UPI00101B9228|nr:hypothetical protein [Rothia halotolerans]